MAQSKTDLSKVEARGREMLATEIRAGAARYDPASGRIILDLTNGCSYAFPADLVEDLHEAAPADLAKVEVDGAGFNLHWPRLDVDLYVPLLVAGIFGTRRWMSGELARLAGRSRSPAKAAAARANGRKGGRPRKAAAG